MDYKLHVVSLPHTQVSKNFNQCAYTAKVYKFMKMFPDATLYANEGSEPDHVQIYSKQDQERLFGHLDWYNKGRIYEVDWNHELPYWVEFNSRVIRELQKRVKPKDIILIITGFAAKPIVDAFTDNIVCEFGVGYEGIYTNFRVFESYAWMHYLYGKKGINDGRFYDTVIPNYFDPADFPYHPAGEEDYLLFMSRPIERKGIEIVKEIAKKGKYKVKVAGTERFEGKNIEWVGYADTKKRGELMANTRALLCPTLYIGPFEGVSVEAQFCGTPVITTDWGCFAETVEDKKTGYRCSTLGEFITATEGVAFLDSMYIRDRAINLYALENVKPQYEAYFNRLQTLHGKGWYTL